MEIKHTIEILTKDIQDIEKLVRNLNNYETPPQIEIDLAMSRLRNVYDLLSLIARDLKSDGLAGGPSDRDQQAVKTQVREQPQQTSNASDATQEQPTSAPTSQAPRPEQVSERQQVIAQEQGTDREQGTDQERGTDREQGTDQERGTDREQGTDRDQGADREQAVEQDQVSAAGTEPGAESNHKKKEAAKKSSILAEKFASDKSINERIAPGSGHDLSTKLTGEPIDSIKRNIGINDRFLIIREIMDGNNEAFNDLVQQLDTQQNFDEAYNIIQSAFPEQMEHEGVNILVRLSRRRYLSR